MKKRNRGAGKKKSRREKTGGFVSKRKQRLVTPGKERNRKHGLKWITKKEAFWLLQKGVGQKGKAVSRDGEKVTLPTWGGRAENRGRVLSYRCGGEKRSGVIGARRSAATVGGRGVGLECPRGIQV